MSKSLYVITGGAGFIGSALLWKFNSMGIENVIIVDEPASPEKLKNIENNRFIDYLDKDEFLELAKNNRLPSGIDTIMHLGACTTTTERDEQYLMDNNYHYSRILSESASRNGIRFIYTSSGATYGDGQLGFSDDDRSTSNLRPLNAYGYSKHKFDLWVLREMRQQVLGIKLFNVFGPNEYHKAEMSSVAYQAFQQIKKTKKVRLFKSYKSEYNDGMQMRDFIYVKDCIEILWQLFEKRTVAGLYNVGTGEALTWKELVTAIFSAMNIEPQIEYIEMPLEVRDHYQYFTEAKLDKLQSTGCTVPFHSIEEATKDYVLNYLNQPHPYLQKG
jgi:ADP-L-glycero-D-manno-heptose 6-epimerase